MSYNTGNAVPSNDVRDLSDNIENIDQWANSTALTATDRFGVERSTLEGVRQGLGFYNVGTFAAGATLTNTRQVLTHSDGHEYGWTGAFPKVVSSVSTPTPLGAGGWVDRSDVTLRTDLLSGCLATRNSKFASRDSVSILDFIPLPIPSDCTTYIQAAIDFAAANGKRLESDGGVYFVTGLIAKSNLVWRGDNTHIALINGSNKPVISNQNIRFTPATRIDENIDIRGVIFDGNGLNQSNEMTGGGPVVGAIFHGVKNLHLDTIVRNSRRYACWLINCETVRGNAISEWTADYIAGGASPNRDSMHINGNCKDVHFSSLLTVRGGDDSLALNADDVDHGGVWTQAAVSGPILGVTVDHLFIDDSDNGIRVLSANYEVSDVVIGNVVGDVTYYAFVAEAYGLGTSSLYRNIKIENLSLTYKDSSDAGRSNTALVKIDTTKHNPTYVSSFEFGTIDRSSYGTDETSKNRQTLLTLVNRTDVKVGRIVERDCSNEITVKVQGDPLNSGLSDRFSSVEICEHVRLNSSNSAGGNRGTSLYAVQCKGIRKISIGSIAPDVLKFGVFLDACEVDTLDVWRTDNSTSDAISIMSGSIVKNMCARGIPSTMFFSAPYVVDDTSSVLSIGVTDDTGPFKTVSTFSNGWSSLGAPYAPIGYRKTAGGIVELRGVLNGGSVNQAAFALPAGFRPAFQKSFACVTSGTAVANLKISASGTITPSDNTSGYVSLDGIAFRAEQ